MITRRMDGWVGGLVSSHSAGNFSHELVLEWGGGDGGDNWMRRRRKVRSALLAKKAETPFQSNDRRLFSGGGSNPWWQIIILKKLYTRFTMMKTTMKMIKDQKQYLGGRCRSVEQSHFIDSMFSCIIWAPELSGG